METIEELKRKFEHFAIEQSLAINEGNGKKVNAYHKKIQKLYIQIKSLGCTEVFKEFLDNENENVRIWAAGYCLRDYPKLAERELMKLTKSKEPIISLSAKATLEFYRKGMWDNLLV